MVAVERAYSDMAIIQRRKAEKGMEELTNST